jgi:hypothetical protein
MERNKQVEMFKKATKYIYVSLEIIITEIENSPITFWKIATHSES